MACRSHLCADTAARLLALLAVQSMIAAARKFIYACGDAVGSCARPAAAVGVVSMCAVAVARRHLHNMARRTSHPAAPPPAPTDSWCHLTVFT